MTGQKQEQKQTCRENHDANQVGRRQPAAEKALIFRVISAEDFYKGAENRIAKQVGGKDLPIEFFAAVQPGQSGIQSKIQEQFIDLGGMDRESLGRARLQNS